MRQTRFKDNATVAAYVCRAFDMTQSNSKSRDALKSAVAPLWSNGGERRNKLAALEAAHMIRKGQFDSNGLNAFQQSAQLAA